MMEYDTKNWLGVVFRYHGTVLPRILMRTVAVAGIGAVLAYADIVLDWQVPLSGTVHAMVGVALGLLLVFRTNASYDRYWEGRKLLGGIVNNSRDMARQAASYLVESPAARDRVERYTIALYVTIRRYLRKEREWPELVDVLDADERARLAEVAAPPLLVAKWLTDVFAIEARAGRISEQQLKLADQTIADIVDMWGGAERILKTPVPLAYAHHIKAFLTIFCFTAPLALVGGMGWYTPIAAAVVAFGLYGIDEIGVEIEDPFGYDPNDLPLDAIGETIARNVRETLAAAQSAPAQRLDFIPRAEQMTAGTGSSS